MNDSSTLAPDSYPYAALKSADLLIAEGKPEIALHVIEAALHKLAAENDAKATSPQLQSSYGTATESLITKFREASIIYKYRRKPLLESALRVGIGSAIVSFFAILTTGVILKLAEPLVTAPVNTVAKSVSDTIKAQIPQIGEAIRLEVPRIGVRLTDSFEEHLKRGVDARLEKLVDEKLAKQGGSRRKAD